MLRHVNEKISLPLSPMASLVLTDSSQLRADGFEKLPYQIMYPYVEPYDLQKTSVPASMTGAVCQTNRMVQYLRDWSGSCVQIVPRHVATWCGRHKPLNIASYYEGVNIVATPHLINSTFFRLSSEVT
uniref:Uncharacterized protein n=1 Tax=Timema bartmani TaxID=61472 RepID=A0A7R9FBK4_9NEOP|nr:unnamed protein product [Timema bartmani]